MLEDAAGIRRVVLACGTVDLRKGIDGLAMIIGDKYKQNPFEKGTLFLFCGKRSDRCKGLLWMETGFLLFYKRFEDGRMSWPRNRSEAAELTEEQYRYLMLGLTRWIPGSKMWIRQKYTDICAKQRKYFSVFCIHRGKPHNGNGQGQDTSRYFGKRHHAHISSCGIYLFYMKNDVKITFIISYFGGKINALLL